MKHISVFSLPHGISSYFTTDAWFKTWELICLDLTVAKIRVSIDTSNCKFYEET